MSIENFTKSYIAMAKKNDVYKENKWQHCVHSHYSLEDVRNIIESGGVYDKQKLSRDFYLSNGLYNRVITYYATLLTYTGLVTPHIKNGKTMKDTNFQKRYAAAQAYIENLHLPITLNEISTSVLVNGYYSAIINPDKQGLNIIDLPLQYTRSLYKDIYGNDLIELNVAYFDSIRQDDIRLSVLKSFPKYIVDYYHKYKHGKVSEAWLLLPANETVYFAMNQYSIPFFLSMIPTILQYEGAIETERDREAEEVRKIIINKIPHLNDGTLLFDPNEAEVMHNGLVDMLSHNKNISVVTTYGDMDSIVSKTTDAASATLDNMRQTVYSAAGVSGQIFSSTGSQAINISIQNDLSVMMSLARKYSKVITMVLNKLFGNGAIEFTYAILPISEYNRKEFLDQSFKLAQSGYSFLLPNLALGMNDRDLIDMKDVENNYLNLNTILKPLASSYTQSSSGNPVGAPEKSLEEKSVKTIANEQAMDNN